MTYLKAHNRPGRRAARIAGIAIGAIVLIWLVLRLFLPQLLPALFTAVAEPFWRMEFSVNSGSLQSPQALLAEDQELEQQVADLQAQNASVQAIESDNQDLEAILGRASTTPYILGAVLARPPLSPYDELVIDIGMDHDLSTTSLVYAPGDVLIGQVSEARSDTSVVELFSSPGQKYQVLIGPTHAPASAVGRGGGQYQAELSRDIDISAGDDVLSSGLDDRPFGIVTAVESDPADPFQTILFAPPVNEYDLRWVLVKK